MSQQEDILSPTRTELLPLNISSRRSPAIPEAQDYSPTSASKLFLKSLNSPNKSNHVPHDKSPKSLSELESLRVTEPKSTTKLRLPKSTMALEDRHKRVGSTAVSTITATTMTSLQRRNRKMIKIHIQDKKKKLPDDFEFDLNNTSNSYIYELQDMYYKEVERKAGKSRNPAKREEQEKIKKKFTKLLRYKLAQPPIYEKPPSYFNEYMHRAHREKRILPKEQLRDIEIGEKVFNSIVLAFDDPLSKGNAYPAWMDTLFLIVYTIEMLLKIFAKGFIFSHRAYLKELWNIMDFTIVVSAYLPYIITSGGINLKALRALRVLRPLRTISKIQKLRELILTLMSVFGDLLETLLVLCFFLMIFAIGGLQMFIGLSKKRCFEALTGIIIATPGQNSENLGFAYCSDDDSCLKYSPTAICGKMIAQIDYGTTSYDDFPHAYLMSFQVITAEGWTEIMGFVQKTFSPWAAIYFVVLVLCATFVILQLILAVLNGGFETAAEKIAEENAMVKTKKIHIDNEGLVKALERNKIDIVDLMRKLREGLTYKARYKLKKNSIYAIDDRFSIASYLGFASTMANNTRKKKSMNGENRLLPSKNRIADLAIKMKDLSKSLVFDDGRRTINSLSEAKALPQIELRRADTIMEHNNDNHLEKMQDTPMSIQRPIDFSPPHRDYQSIQSTGSVNSLGDKSSERGEKKEVLWKPVTKAYISKKSKVSEMSSARDNKSSIPEIDEESESLTDRVLPSPKLKPIISGIRPHKPEEKIRVDNTKKMSLKVEVAEIFKSKAFHIINIAGVRNVIKPKDSTDDAEKEEEDPDDFFDEVKNIEPQKPRGEEALKLKFRQKMNRVQANFATIITNKHVETHKRNYIPSEDLDRDEIHVQPELNTMDILDDSDFFDDKKPKVYLKRKNRRNSSHAFSEFRLFRKALAKSKKDLETPLPMFDQPLESPDIIPIEPEEIESSNSEEEEQDYPIDLRLIQPDPLFSRVDYVSHSQDDVLPSLIESKRKAIEDNDMKRIREACLPIEYITTQVEMKQSEIRENFRDKILIMKAAKNISIKKNERTRKFKNREQKLREEKEREEDLQQKFIHEKSRTRKPKRPFNFVPKNYHNLPGVSDNDKDFDNEDILLKKIMAPYDDEEDWLRHDFVEEITADLPKKENWLQIRNDDLKINKIKVKKDWSGTQVLARTHAYFDVKSVKETLNQRNFDIWRPGWFGVFTKSTQKSKSHNFSVIPLHVNVLTLAADSLVTGDEGSNLLASMNEVFTFIFITELGLKVFAMGILEYMSDKMNLFDALIVSVSIIELAVLTGPNKAASAFRAVRLFRTFRVLRVTKLLRSLAYMKIIMGVISRSVSKMTWIAVLMLLFLYIYTLLGMQLFGGNLSFPDNVGDDRVRQNYDTFISSFMTTFQIMTQENWNTVLDFSYRSPDVNSLIAIFYLISWLCIGNWVFLNLLLATVLDEFTNDEAKQDERELKDEEEEILEAEKKNPLPGLMSNPALLHSVSRLRVPDGLASQTTLISSRTGLSSSKSGVNIIPSTWSQKTGVTGITNHKSIANLGTGLTNKSMSGMGTGLSGQKTTLRNLTRRMSVGELPLNDDQEEDKKEILNLPFDYSMLEIKTRRSLYVFPKSSFVRMITYRIVKSHRFEHAVFFAIFVSSIKLVVDTYIDDNSEAGTISSYIDYGIN